MSYLESFLLASYRSPQEKYADIRSTCDVIVRIIRGKNAKYTYAASAGKNIRESPSSVLSRADFENFGKANSRDDPKTVTGYKAADEFAKYSALFECRRPGGNNRYDERCNIGALCDDNKKW